MDFSTLEKAWRKQIVTCSKEAPEAVAAKMKQEITSAQRRIRGGIILAVFVLLAGWATTIAVHITSIKRLTPVGMIAEAVNAMLFLLFFVRAFRSARGVRKEAEMMAGTLRESVAATLRTVELQIQNARMAGYVIPIVVAINAWLFFAKYLGGDIPGFGAAMASALTAAMGTVIGAIIWHRYRTHLSPRRNELKELLKMLESE